MMRRFRYSVFGLGKLGASIAAAIASRGHDVVGVDVNPATVEMLNAGRSPVDETGVQELLAHNRERLHATTHPTEAIRSSDVTFVVVPTPSDERGAFRLDLVADALASIGNALAGKRSYHLVVITSTVLPGSTRQRLLPVLEQASGKRCGPDIGLCYSPEFVALGNVIHDFLHPDFILIGDADPQAGALLEECYRSLLPCMPPCRRMSTENAELAKLSVNAFVTTKIAFANMLADLCSQIGGGDVDAVCDAIGLDPRIGRRCLTGGLGFGGPCFPRDNAALSFFADRLGVPAPLADATRAANEQWAQRILARLADKAKPGSTVAVLGLAYKTRTSIVEQSHGLLLAQELGRLGVQVVAHDTHVRASGCGPLDGDIWLARTPQECVASADTVVVALPDPHFGSLQPSDFGRRPVTIVDCWRQLTSLSGRADIEYVGLGLGHDGESTEWHWLPPAQLDGARSSREAT